MPRVPHLRSAPAATDRRPDKVRTDEVLKMAGALFAGGVGGEAWTCDRQTNGINFIQFVCSSPWLLDRSGPAVSEMKHGLATDRRMG